MRTNVFFANQEPQRATEELKNFVERLWDFEPYTWDFDGKKHFAP